MIDLGKRIKELRLSYNYKNAYFANLLEITPVFLSYIENGTRKPSLGLLEKICDVLGITLSDFFNTKEDTISPELNILINNAKNLSPTQIKLVNNIIDNLKG